MAEMPIKVNGMTSLLTFEIGSADDELFVHGDPTSLRRLASLLENMALNAEQGKFPHEHLFSPEWGGDDLTTAAQVPGHRCLLHVKIFGWPTATGSQAYQA